MLGGALSSHIPFIMTIICVSTHLEKADCAKRCLNRLHLRVLGEQHVLDTRFTVIQWTVPRYVITTTKCVFCRNTKKECRFYTCLHTCKEFTFFHEASICIVHLDRRLHPPLESSHNFLLLVFRQYRVSKEKSQ